MGGQDCKNNKVEDFTNSNGFKGYKVYRTRTITGQSPGVYEDVAYVFPIKTAVNGEGLINYAGVLFAVDPVSSENLATLDKIADTVFNLM